ncbi:ATP-binding protein [Schinkia azotoformans]|uniref:histidine kinase n=2 Tax=Schinkia azotoformans TaxID=1454 RepID=K6D4L8_SCHAZ|nr:PAS domain-containing sensor histidine kinase [Schinkia azotoformans]EKN63234.1 sensory box histidine kinase [Schinkia azotoformans LMG 9581]MEC1637214.1 ATP-binding protein [Schinkia azotoformans]MEC1720662.1 ATP-binding protein [Schinkia azotoformans]MEC1943618.1 ATP-binding protein [Schinkia azotoformans]MED4411801.1 ATP-binding protein [Schinkia azotoformans]
MKQFFRSKITKRYLLITLLLTLCALSLLYLITTQVMNKSVSEEKNYRNELMAQTVGKKMNYIFSNIINELRVLSEYALRVQEGEVIDIEEAEKIISRNPLFLHSKLVDEHGDTLFAIPNVYISDSPKSVDIFDRLSWSKTYYISNLFSLENGKKVIAVSVPIIDEHGLFKGGIIAFINLDVLSQYLNQVKIGVDGVNALIDRDGNVISHSDSSFIGTNIATHQLGDYLYKNKSGIWEGDLFNKRMFFAYQPIQLGNFGIIVGEPIQQALASTKNVQELLLKGFLTVTLLTLIFTFYATSRFVEPITHLTKQAREYKDGFRQSFQIIKTGDELETLSITMDEMARELSKRQKKLINILESIPYAVITIDKEGNIVTFNKGAEQLTLFSRKEAIGKKIIDLPIKKSKDEFFVWQTVQLGKEFNEVESEIYDKQGQTHIINIYSSLFYDDKNQNMGTLLILRDVSEIKRIEAYLKQSERLASLGQLTAGIAHEIKNPLGIITAAAEAIELELQEENIEIDVLKDMTQDIIETAERMNLLLTDFLKMSKGESKDLKAKVNMLSLIQELLSLLRNKLDEHQITVQLNNTVNEVPFVGIEKKLNQVFLNIFLNSIQAMENGGVLTISVTERIRDWKIEIEDTGKGIPESEINWIFNPFYTTKKEGTGLGLAIAYEIITEHNGKIDAFSKVGDGTIISIYLPKEGGAI